MKPLLFILAAALAFAQPPTSIIPGTAVTTATINSNFLGLYDGRVGRWSGAGAPGSVAFSITGDLYFNTASPGQVYGCYRTPCTAVGSNNWVLVSTGGTIGSTGNVLKGDNAGNAISAGFAATAAGIVSLFTGCSGTLALGADGACHNSGGNTYTPVSFSATPTFTRSSANQEWSITLTGNVTSSSTSGLAAGDIVVLNVIQDATGSRTFVPPTGFGEMCTISATALIGTKQTFYWDGSAAHAMTPCVTTSSTNDLMYTDQSNTVTAGTQDFSGAAHTLPEKVGAVSGLPATCAVGEKYFANNATAGQNDYFCTATNTWTQQLNSGGSATNTTPWICMGGCGGTYGGGLTTVANTIYCWLQNIPSATQIAKMYFYTGAATNQKWAIYSANGSSSALLASSSVGTGCGGCEYSLALSYTITTPGAYYFCFSSDGNASFGISATGWPAPSVGSISSSPTATTANTGTWSGGAYTFPSTTGALTATSTGYPLAAITY